MSDLKDYLLNEVIKPHTDNILGHTRATVVKYDYKINKASVLFQHPVTLGIVQLFDVPVQIGSGGVHSAGPFPGDDVWIQFDGGDIKRPKITSLADDDYQIDTRELRTKHERKGAYIPNATSERSYFEHTLDEDRPGVDSCTANNVEDWVSSSGIGDTMYSNNSNPISDIDNEIAEAPHYDIAEPGITHPKTNATIKLKNNGMIHLFVDKDEGIVIDPTTKSITLLTENINEHAENYTLLADGDSYIRTKKNWTLYVQGDTHIKCENYITIEAKKDILVKSDTNITVDAKKDILVKAGNNMRVEAENEMYFKARHITSEADRYDYL